MMRRALGAIGLLTAVAATVAAGLVATAGSAYAADDEVNLRSARSFTAGGRANTVSITVERREKGCVSVRTGLALSLDGMEPDQVRVEAYTGGGWRELIVSPAGGDAVVTERIAPERANICDRQSTTARYRVSFTSEAPGGSATIVGEAYNGRGNLIERDTETARVIGAKATAKKSPSPKPSKSATPTPPSATEDPFGDQTEAPQALGVPRSEDGGGFTGAGGAIMVGGVLLLLVGVGLIVFLVRGLRGERAGKVGAHSAAAAGGTGVPFGGPAPFGGSAPRGGTAPFGGGTTPFGGGTTPRGGTAPFGGTAQYGGAEPRAGSTIPFGSPVPFGSPASGASDAPTTFIPPVRPGEPEQPTMIFPRVEDK